jgi:hypothetical protein
MVTVEKVQQEILYNVHFDDLTEAQLIALYTVLAHTAKLTPGYQFINEMENLGLEWDDDLLEDPEVEVVFKNRI